MMKNFPDLLTLTDIAVRAGELIMEHYTTTLDITIKEDQSPVTAADIAANTYIVAKLSALTPEIPIVAEENTVSMNSGGIDAETFWLVDPLDGTKSFIKRTGEFTVNIALVHQGVPVLGVVYVPVTEELYYGNANDRKSYKKQGTGSARAISALPVDEDGAIVVASMSHPSKETSDYIETVKVKSLISASSSVKFCLIAEGKAHIYPRFGRTMEWDTAAGHAVLLAAGGSVNNVDGSTLAYGKNGFENPHFIAFGSR